MTRPKTRLEEFEAYAYANHAFFAPVAIKDSVAAVRSLCRAALLPTDQIGSRLNALATAKIKGISDQ
jgi:hypothetical protein